MNTVEDENIIYKNFIIDTLSKYIDIQINDDKSINRNEVENDYFLKNNIWSLCFFECIGQFKERVVQIEEEVCTDERNDINIVEFSIYNVDMNNELKFVAYNKLFTEAWSIKTTIKSHKYNLRRVCSFINEIYPTKNSFKDLNIEEARNEWINWLKDREINTLQNVNYIVDTHKKNIKQQNSVATFLEGIISTLNELTDFRQEWDKDKWDIRNLDKYEIRYSKSNAAHYIDFTKIQNEVMRNETKKYMKNRLIGANKFGWGSACQYMTYVPIFLNFICDLKPSWNNLNDLGREHIEKYIEYLHLYASENLKNRNANPKNYVRQVLIVIKSFLLDIQIKEYSIAPSINVKNLILPEDLPTVPKKSSDSIDYVPNNVLEELFNHINELPEKVVPVVYTMFKTGLRISDTLELTEDCLVTMDKKFWIKSNIQKSYVEDHKIPIDNELAQILSVVIDQNKKLGNDYNNPNKYIFVKYTGRRKGQPYTRKWIQQSLNELVINNNIKDESGNLFHFKNHAFRHTYAIKLLNNGVDIFTVQDLLALSSTETAMRYARLLDSTKREAFDNVVKKGIFKFDEYDRLKEENDGEIPDDIIEMFYTNYKLNSISTPYGSCMQRKNGKCEYAKHPPCLTRNGGSPCKDLCVGAMEDDIKKYEILMESTNNIIENAKIYNRQEMITDNEDLLKLLKSVYSKIVEGNIIYGRLDKFKNNKEY